MRDYFPGAVASRRGFGIVEATDGGYLIETSNGWQPGGGTRFYDILAAETFIDSMEISADEYDDRMFAAEAASERRAGC